MDPLSPSLDYRSKSRLPQYGATKGQSLLANRDKPLFTAMRRPQFQQEFTTDSLNNTAIGSPSPAKDLSGALGRPVRSGRNGGLGNAFRRVDERLKNESKTEQSPENPRRIHAPFTRPASTRQYQTESPKPTPKLIPPRSATRTPSPPRGRTLGLLSPVSAVSEASPPREFAEAYKQIDEAEDLAAQDEGDISDDTDALQGENLYAGRASSKRGSRRRSPGEDDAIILDSPLSKQKEMTQDSLPSLPSDLELSTGVAGNAMPSRFEKDLHRLNEAIGGTKAFSKAKRRTKPGVDELRRDSASSRSGSRSEHSNTSGSILSDGPLNIPSNWGRKARQGRTWLSRVARDGVHDETLAPIRSPKSQAIQDWQAEASMTPLPQAIEHDSLEHSPSPAPTKPSIMSARDRVRKLAFGETGSQEDLLNRTKIPTSDSMRDREIQNLAKSAVTTSRLGELREKRSLERVGGRSPSAQSDDEPRASNSAEDLRGLKPRPSQTALQSVPEELLSSNDTLSSQPGRIKKEAILETDTRDILRELSKVASPSPSPDTTADRKGPNRESGLEQQNPDEVDNSKRPIMQTPAPVKPSQTYLKTPKVTGAWIDTPLPTVKVQRTKDEEQPGDGKETVRDTLKKLDLETLVDESQILREAEAKRQSLQQTAPRLPGSALAAIINRAKDKKAEGIMNQTEDTLNLDDSTILSLEGFLANVEKSAEDSSDDAGFSSSEEDEMMPARQGRNLAKQKIRRSRNLIQDSDSEDDVALTTRLDRLKTSIHDAKVGVGSLQKKINKLPAKPASTRSSRSPSLARSQSECEEAGELHDFIWPCEKCGHKTGSSLWATDDGSLLEWQWRPLQVYMPQLWYWPKSSNVPRPTKLGWIILICSILAMLEAFLCDVYSPPFYATSMEGYGVDINAPRPPFILPQLFWKHVLGSPVSTLHLLLQVIVQPLASFFGISSGNAIVDDFTGAPTSNTRWTYRQAVLQQDQINAMGMDADEIL